MAQQQLSLIDAHQERRHEARDHRKSIVGPDGRRRSHVTAPGYHKGRRPGNAGRRFPAEVLTVQEMYRLLDACGGGLAGSRDRALYTVLWRTGLRIAESLDLYPKDIDLTLRTVTVRNVQLVGCGNVRKQRSLRLNSAASNVPRNPCKTVIKRGVQTSPDRRFQVPTDARIPLYRRDGSVHTYVLVDQVDFEWLNQWRWYYAVSTRGAQYGATAYRAPMTNGRRTRIAMHREIMGHPEGLVVDHVNGNSLDNRRVNLRVVTRSQNQQNRTKGATARSGYRGVRYRKDCPGRPWAVVHYLDGKWCWGGSFTTPEEANEAAIAWRAEHMPYSSDARRAAA